MDADRFDTLARSLTRGGASHHALAGLVAGAIGLLGARAEESAAHELKATCKKKSGQAKKKCLKKAKKHAAQHAAEDASGGGGGGGGNDQPPPPFCASQPDGTACGYCRLCQSGACQADSTQNNAACGSDGTGRCLNGRCNPVPTCSPRNGPCQTVADCCSAGST
jgi:hypothetical protein